VRHLTQGASAQIAMHLAQVTVLSLMSVTELRRGPQYSMTSTSLWLHSALHAAASQLERVTRMALSVAGVPAAPGDAGA
jgi:hypothetical protein